MAALQVIKMGHPILRRSSQALSRDEIIKPHTQALIKDMVHTMRSQRGIGLAAPQVSVNKQLMVVELAKDRSVPKLQGTPICWIDTQFVQRFVVFNFDSQVCL